LLLALAISRTPLTLALSRFVRLAYYAFSVESPPCLRSRATATGSFKLRNPSKVARTTLWGFEEPIDFVTTSRTPTNCITARTGPPAITPFPSGAGLSSTRPAPKTPSVWCGMVEPESGTRVRVFFAHDHKRREGEVLAALHNLGDAID